MISLLLIQATVDSLQMAQGFVGEYGTQIGAGAAGTGAGALTSWLVLRNDILHERELREKMSEVVDQGLKNIISRVAELDADTDSRLKDLDRKVSDGLEKVHVRCNALSEGLSELKGRLKARDNGS